VEELKKETLKELCDRGCVVSLSGRKLYFKDAEDYTSTGRYTAAAKRKAFNFLLQGSETDIVKRAMIALSKELERNKMKSVVLAMVHDSIIFSMPYWGH
jgi:DNA polymerase-1